MPEVYDDRVAGVQEKCLPAAWDNYCTHLLRQRRARRAIRALTRSLSLSPDVWALNDRGLACLKAGKLDRARRDFEAALGIDPQFAAARRNLASLRSGPAASDAP